MKYIIGISVFFDDSDAGLIKDTEIFSAVQEKRFTRIKHDIDFRKESTQYCLKTIKCIR